MKSSILGCCYTMNLDSSLRISLLNMISGLAAKNSRRVAPNHMHFNYRTFAGKFAPGWATLQVERTTGNSRFAFISTHRHPGISSTISSFSICNEFNCTIKHCSYSLRRSQWQHNFDYLFVTSLVFSWIPAISGFLQLWRKATVDVFSLLC